MTFEQTGGTPISAIHAEEPERTIGFLGNFSAEFIQMLNTRFEVQPSQASFIANALVTNYPALTTKGYALFLSRFAMGKYGTFYGSFDVMKFFESLSIFYSEFEAYWQKVKTKRNEQPIDEAAALARVQAEQLRSLVRQPEMNLRAQSNFFQIDLDYFKISEEQYLTYRYPDPERRPRLGIKDYWEYMNELRRLGYTGNETI